jgi:sarcosine oxidase alpha subunit family protein
MTGAHNVTLASEAVRSGDPAVSRSFRFHRRRGPVCGRGYCAQCKIMTPDGRALACEAPPGAGAARRTPDVRRAPGRVAENWVPWFYEKRFLKPRALRRTYLEVIRRMSAAAPLGAALTPPPHRDYRELQVGSVLIGRPGDLPTADLVVDGADVRAVGMYGERQLGVLFPDALAMVSFERLTIATESYERLPPIEGNDLPGVIGLTAAERYGEAGALGSGLRVAVWLPDSAKPRLELLARRHGLDVVWSSSRAPSKIAGRRRVEKVVDGRSDFGCSLFIVGVGQPALEVAAQAGAQLRLTDDGLPILALGDAPDWLTVVGGAVATSAEVPDVPAADSAFACLCEDVRVGDLRRCVRTGFRDVELVKRRTGAMTGPCQGKLCAALTLSVLREEGIEPAPMTPRPLTAPIELSKLAADA